MSPTASPPDRATSVSVRSVQSHGRVRRLERSGGRTPAPGPGRAPGADVGHHPDDFLPGRAPVWPLLAARDPLADRVLAGERLAREALVDDHGQRRAPPVPAVEQPAAHQLDPHGCEVARRHQPHHGVDRGADVERPALGNQPVAAPALQRRGRDQAAAVTPGDGRDLLGRCARTPAPPARVIRIRPRGATPGRRARPRGSNPGSTPLSAIALRISSPAPVSSTSASAISATTSALRSRSRLPAGTRSARPP